MSRRLFLDPSYSRRAAKLLGEEQDAMEASIGADPERHPVVAGTGGVRKARWRRPGGGKRGGVRVIYYFAPVPDSVYFLAIYAKSEQENLSDADKKVIRKIVEDIKARERAAN
jgi:hypothetical protein